MGCEITDSYGFIVQICLGVLSFLVLIYKRQKERPKRFCKIWALVVSALAAHSLNVILAVVLSDESSEVDACNWYFVTIVMDTTIGVFICFTVLSLLESIFTRYGMIKFKSGNYFAVITPGEQHEKRKKKKSRNGPSQDNGGIALLKPIVRISYLYWLIQLIIWNSIVVASKSLLFLIQTSAAPILQPAVNFILSPLDSLSQVKLVLVMAIIPSILNSIQFWIQDNFLKKKQFNPVEKEYFACQIFEQNEEHTEHDNSLRDYEIQPQNQLATRTPSQTPLKNPSTKSEL